MLYARCSSLWHSWNKIHLLPGIGLFSSWLLLMIWYQTEKCFPDFQKADIRLWSLHRLWWYLRLLIFLWSLEYNFPVLWTTHCLKPMGFLLRRPRNLLSPQALIRTVPVLYCYSFYAIRLNPSSSIFFAALISLSCVVPQTGHTHSLTDRFFVSVFWYPQTEHSWLLA